MAEQFSFRFKDSRPAPEQESITQEMLEELPVEALFQKYKETVGVALTLRYFHEDETQRKQQIVAAILNAEQERSRLRELHSEEDKDDVSGTYRSSR